MGGLHHWRPPNNRRRWTKARFSSPYWPRLTAAEPIGAIIKSRLPREPVIFVKISALASHGSESVAYRTHSRRGIDARRYGAYWISRPLDFQKFRGTCHPSSRASATFLLRRRSAASAKTVLTSRRHSNLRMLTIIAVFLLDE